MTRIQRICYLICFIMLTYNTMQFSQGHEPCVVNILTFYTAMTGCRGVSGVQAAKTFPLRFFFFFFLFFQNAFSLFSLYDRKLGLGRSWTLFFLSFFLNTKLCMLIVYTLRFVFMYINVLSSWQPKAAMLKRGIILNTLFRPFSKELHACMVLVHGTYIYISLHHYFQ